MRIYIILYNAHCTINIPFTLKTSVEVDILPLCSLSIFLQNLHTNELMFAFS